MQDITVFIQNHWLLSLVLVIVLFLLIILEFIKQKSGGARLTPRQVTDFINHKEAVIVDLRDTEAFNKGHILNAISLPFKDIEQKIQKLEKFKSQPLIVVCATGVESQRAFVTLQNKGFNAQVLAGGMRAWRESDLPVVKS